VASDGMAGDGMAGDGMAGDGVAAEWTANDRVPVMVCLAMVWLEIVRWHD
jgi:hypothetical protein